MNFVSMEFVLFCPPVLLLSHMMCSAVGKCFWPKMRIMFLLTVSYLFYMNGISLNGIFRGLLLLISTAFTWHAALRIQKAENAKIKKAVLAAAACYCIGCLCIFKRKDFLVPGVSFYIFQMLSYVLDVYWERTECETDFTVYALYVSFFPQLTAGPVERSIDLLPQFKQNQPAEREKIREGCWLILRGFFKKLAVADYLSGFAEAVFGAPERAGGLAVILAVFFFSVQIYCDFSGYTDIARGTACMMGIRLSENFHHPYQACSIKDFWRRWHNSLTRWFTDYLYIPLGGSRKGILCTVRNILLVFAASGLWHGLSWHYAVWGLLHGCAMSAMCILEYFRKKHADLQKENIRPHGLLYRTASQAAVLLFIGFAWIFFRAETLRDAWILLGQILWHFGDDSPRQLLQSFSMRTADICRIFLLFFCLSLLEKTELEEKIIRKNSAYATKAALAGFYMLMAAVLSWMSVLAASGGNVFIYFSF